MMTCILLHLYIIFFLITLFIGSFEVSTISLYSNISTIVDSAIFIHGLAFSYYFLISKKVNNAVAILILIPLAILRPITILIRLFSMTFRIRLIMDLSNN